jgi:hypothetical protein
MQSFNCALGVIYTHWEGEKRRREKHINLLSKKDHVDI